MAEPPHPDSPKDVATLSLKVLKDSESAARPVGRYLLHANAVVCLVLLPSCCVGLLLHVVFCVVPPPLPPLPMRGSGLGQKSSLGEIGSACSRAFVAFPVRSIGAELPPRGGGEEAGSCGGHPSSASQGLFFPPFSKTLSNIL